MTNANGTVPELAALHESLDARWRPEDVARQILTVLHGRLTPAEHALLDSAANVWRPRWWVSSMPEDFERPVDAARVVTSVARAFELPEVPQVDVADPAALRALAYGFGDGIGFGGWGAGTDFRDDRRNRHVRHTSQLDVSRRKYNRRFRALRRLLEKAGTLERQQLVHRLMLAGRSGFAMDIGLDRFAADPDAACLVAYYVARRNVRRQFSLAGKDSPWDEVCQALYDRCTARDGTDWGMVAHVATNADVLTRVGDEERGQLMGQWTTLMRQAAGILGELAERGNLDRVAMVVQRGDDSSTWNTVAQGYNRARAAWIALLDTSDALDLLDAACPGKVMRVMAADLVRWHGGTSGGLHPDTAVWASLPAPWQVFAGEVVCTRASVEAACYTAGLDPEATGWTAPRPIGVPAPFRPTSELVHGVEVADPQWAALLRRAGVFSGKKLREYVGPIPAGVVVGDLPVIQVD